MKIAVIGGGWYGCHIASALKAHGADVTLLEKQQRLFDEASGNNQFRLHLGLHYARSAITRHQSRDGFSRFSERYPRFSRPVARNIYVVPRHTSMLDFETYFSIMYSSGIHIEKLPLDQLDFLRRDQLGGALTCLERVVMTQQAREHFTRSLNGTVQLGVSVPTIVDALADRGPVLLGERFDWVVDATWGALAAAREDCYFEPTLLLYYRQRGAQADEPFPALTLVDGNLWSIYPMETEGRYTLSSVTHTPLGRYATKAEAYQRLAAIGSDDIAARRRLMEQEVGEIFPDFSDRFEYEGPQLSIKTKPVGRTDDRSASIRREGRIFRVQSGKIDTIFHAGDAILGALLNG
jgi:hypothetical protein